MNKGEKKSYNLISEVISETVDNYAVLQKKYAELQKKYKELQNEYEQVLDDYLEAINDKLDLEEEVMALRHAEKVKDDHDNMIIEMRRESDEY